MATGNEKLGADEHSIMGREIGIMCVALDRNGACIEYYSQKATNLIKVEIGQPGQSEGPLSYRGREGPK